MFGEEHEVVIKGPPKHGQCVTSKACHFDFDLIVTNQFKFSDPFRTW